MHLVSRMCSRVVGRTSRLITSVAVLSLLQGTNIAGALPAQPGAGRTVGMFDLFCHRQVPNLGRVAEIAQKGGFAEIQGTDLEKYQPPVRAEELKAWRFTDHGEEFVMTTAKSLPDDQFKSEVPEFANSISYSCSLIAPVHGISSSIISEMTTLIGRSFDDSWDQSPLKAHVWCGRTETMFACTYYWAPVEPTGTGMLTPTVFVKN